MWPSRLEIQKNNLLLTQPLFNNLHGFGLTFDGSTKHNKMENLWNIFFMILPSSVKPKLEALASRLAEVEIKLPKTIPNQTTSMKDNDNGRWPKWKTTSVEDSLNRRQPHLKMTSIEEDLIGRRTQWKMTTMEVNLNGRRP